MCKPNFVIPAFAGMTVWFLIRVCLCSSVAKTLLPFGLFDPARSNTRCLGVSNYNHIAGEMFKAMAGVRMA
jgi:hypothetical protein